MNWIVGLWAYTNYYIPGFITDSNISATFKYFACFHNYITRCLIYSLLIIIYLCVIILLFVVIHLFIYFNFTQGWLAKRVFQQDGP